MRAQRTTLGLITQFPGEALLAERSLFFMKEALFDEERQLCSDMHMNFFYDREVPLKAKLALRDLELKNLCYSYRRRNVRPPGWHLIL
jgi:hypothetical protein